MSHRILAKLDIKHGKVIKGVEFEGVRQVGDPIELAKKYYKEQIDEIIYLDCVASLYNRSHLIDLLPGYLNKSLFPFVLEVVLKILIMQKNSLRMVQIRLQ